jgi:hypothetical protein
MDVNPTLTTIEPDKPRQFKLDWTKDSHLSAYKAELIEALGRENINNRLDAINLANARQEAEAIVRALNNIMISAHKATEQKLTEANASKPDYLKRIEANKRKSWWNKDLEEVHKLKKMYNARYKASNLELDHLLFNHYRTAARKLQRKQTKEARNKDLIDMTNQYKTNKRRFWMTSRRLRNKKVEVDIALKDLQSVYADTFNNKLIQSRTDESLINQLKIKAAEIIKKPGTIRINELLVQDIIKGLKNNKLAGISGVTNEMVKYNDDIMTPLITKLLEKMIIYHATPESLNVGLLFPIIKDDKESPSSTNNIRPITLSDTIAIIYECYILSVIEQQFQEHELQFGFRKNYSVNHAMFTLRETILSYRAKSKPVYACFLDFSKAFDKINRWILLNKMKKFLDDDHWLSIYLYYLKSSIIITNRGERSNPMVTTLGCKQGGPMSPKLFSIYVNEMIEIISTTSNICSIGEINSGIILYADDTTIICPTPDDLRATLRRIEEYCLKHEISINTKKTKCMVFGSKQQINHNEEIYINNLKLDFVDKFKYLGVWLRNNLNCNDHIKSRKATAIAAAYKLNALGINSNILNAELKSFLINVYCRSSLQYGIENSYLNESDYKEMTSIEARIIKRALGLSKYHSTTMIINALKTQPIVTMIKTRKLAFVKQLWLNPLTRRILNQQLDKLNELATKSFVRELIRIMNVNIHTLKDEHILKISQETAKKMKAEAETAKGTKEAVAIRYLLDHRTKQNDELVRKLTHWSDKPNKSKPNILRRTSCMNQS